MVTPEPRPVDLVYTKRGQRQDAENAMGSDPIRAIIELVTNADDAYSRLEQDPGSNVKNGRIKVSITRRRGRSHLIEVADRAGGMTIEEMEFKLGRAGERTSGFEEGRDVRGLFGRGAKDVAHFGRAEWTSIKHGQKGWFSIDLRRDGPAGEIRGPEPSTERHSGTAVTLEVEQRFTLSTNQSLRDKLQRHYALRPILMNRNGRDLLLKAGGEKAKRLTYHEPEGQTLEDKRVLEIPDYPDHSATLVLKESSTSLIDDLPADYWHHSLLIRSGAAAYGMFRSGKYRREPYSHILGFLFGSVEVPAINELIREHDDFEQRGEEPPKHNPIRMVSRDRAGLVAPTEHPFVRSLYDAIEEALEPHVERLRKSMESDAGENVSAKTRERFRQAGEVLTKFMREAGEEELGGGLEGGTQPPFGLSLIPAKRVVPPGQKGSMTVRYRPVAPVESARCTLTMQVLGQPVAHPSSLVLSMRSQGYFSATFTVPGGANGDVMDIDVRMDDEVVAGQVVWQAVPPPRITCLQFEHAHNTVRDGTVKNLRLLAPVEMLQDADDVPEISIQGSSGITKAGEPSVFRSSSFGDFVVSIVPVRGLGLNNKARIAAVASGQQAETQLEVTAVGVSGLEPKLEKHDNNLRAWIDAERGNLILNAKHSALARYLGPESQNWPGQETPQFRSMLGELMTATAVRSVLIGKHKERKCDVNEMFFDYVEQCDKLSPRLHQALISDSETRRIAR